MTPEQLQRELAKYHQPIPATDRPLRLRMLVYGTWGAGKTILSLRVGERPLHLVTEPSDDSLRDWPELASRVEVVEYGGVNHLKYISEAFSQGIYTNDTLVIDTVSELIELQLGALQTNWHSPKQSRPTFKGKSNNIPDIEIVGVDDYRAVRDALVPVINSLCKLPINLIFIAHERDVTWADEQKNNKDGTPLPPFRPDLPSQTLKMIAKRVSVVGRMTRQGDIRQLSFRTDQKSKEEVKSRIKELDGKRMSDEDFLAIVNKWRIREDG